MKTLTINYKLQSGKAKTKTILVVLNLNTKYLGKYLQVSKTTGKSVLPSEWDSRRGLPTDVHLATKMMHMQDSLNYYLKKEMSEMTDEQVVSTMKKGMWITLLTQWIDEHLHSKKTPYRQLMEDNLYSYENRRDVFYKELLTSFQLNNLRLVDPQGNTIDELGFFNPNQNIKVKHHVLQPAGSNSLQAHPKVKEIDSCLLDKDDIQKYGTMPFVEFVELVNKKKIKSGDLKPDEKSGLTGYDTLVSVFKDFDEAITLNEVNDDVFENFLDYVEEERDVDTSSLGNYKKWIKAVIHYGEDEFKMMFNSKKLNIKSKIYARTNERKTRPYLNEEMLDIMLAYQFAEDKKHFDYIRDLFYLQCYTCVAYSDIPKIFTKPETLSIDGKYERFVHMRRKKTGTEADILINDEVYSILEKYNFQYKEITLQYYNRAIQDMLEQVGFNFDFVQKVYNPKKKQETTLPPKPFNKFMGSHSGRRSFITNMKKKGISDESIMSQSQHKSINTLNIYFQDSANVGFQNFVKELRSKQN